MAAVAEPTKLPSETSAENMEMRHRFRCQYVPVDSAGDVHGLDASPDYLRPSGFGSNSWRRCSVFLYGGSLLLGLFSHHSLGRTDRNDSH